MVVLLVFLYIFYWPSGFWGKSENGDGDDFIKVEEVGENKIVTNLRDNYSFSVPKDWMVETSSGAGEQANTYPIGLDSCKLSFNGEKYNYDLERLYSELENKKYEDITIIKNELSYTNNHLRRGILTNIDSHEGGTQRSYLWIMDGVLYSVKMYSLLNEKEKCSELLDNIILRYNIGSKK